MMQIISPGAVVKSHEQVVEEMMIECKKIIGTDKFKGKKIKWEWANSAYLTKDKGCLAYIENEGRNYTIYLPDKFMYQDWAISDADGLVVDEIAIDFEGNPESGHEEQFLANSKACTLEMYEVIFHELLHAAYPGMPHSEVYPKSIKLAEETTAKNWDK